MANIDLCDSQNRMHVIGSIAVAFFLTVCISTSLHAQETTQDSDVVAPKKLTYALAIHGGAGSSPDMFSDEQNQSRYDSMEKALSLGKKILAEGGTSLDAVEAVVKLLEDDPQFNAGKGAVFNAESGHELDASIMDGRNLACGAVAGVKTIKNPISLARLVMSDTPHVMLSGAGADLFGKTKEVELVPNNYFDTSATKKRWEEYQQERAKQKESETESKSQSDSNDQASKNRPDFEFISRDTGSYMGTVGCVALDSHGNLAAATSTGGMTNKQFGRVGDSPIIAAGTYADNETCAVSCTGHGEEYIKHVVAYDVAARMKYQEASVNQAVTTILADELPAAAGGIIAVDRNGLISMEFSTGGMARAAADSTGRFEVVWHKAETSTSGK